MKTRIAYIAAIAALWSCSHQEVENETEALLDQTSFLTNKAYIEKATLKERQEYTEYHLFQLTEHVMELDPTFGKWTMIGKADGTAALYLENIYDNASRTQKGNDKDISFSLNAFKDLEGQTWYPVIEVLRPGNGNPKNGVYLMTVFDEALGQKTVRAFKMNARGKLVPHKKRYLKEEYESDTRGREAKSPYYFLTLSECPPLTKDQLFVADCTELNDFADTGKALSYNLKVINIRDKKESWLERADIRDTDWLWPNIQSGTYYFPVNASIDGALIGKVRSKDLNKNLGVNHFITNRSRIGALQYLIFEHDKFPAPTQISRINGPNNSTFGMEYRSYNKLYDHQVFNVNTNYTGIPNIANFSINKPGLIYYQIQ